MLLKSTSTVHSDSALPQLDLAGFTLLATVIGQAAGINLGSDKRLMVQTRLMRRLRQLQLTTFAEYVRYVTTSTTQELPHL